MVENCVRLVLFFENVGLDKLQDVSSHSFHRLDHRVVLGIVADDGRRYLLRVQVVDLEQIAKYGSQIIEVDLASALSNALIYFYNVIDSFDILVLE